MNLGQDSSKENPIIPAITCAALGKLISQSLSALTPEQLRAAAESEAVQVLERIYPILEDPRLDDPACLQKIEAITAAYYQTLGVGGTRHWEQD